jgi:hypothetical protein
MLKTFSALKLVPVTLADMGLVATAVVAASVAILLCSTLP